MIELGNKTIDSSEPIHPFLKPLIPVVDDYMEGLKNSENNSSNTSFPNSNHSGVGTIHKNLWNFQTNVNNEEFIDIQSIWDNIHLPILKNFYNLKLSILKNHNIWNDNDYKKLREHVPCIVELRKLTNKYTKFFKKATEFYYSLLLDYIEVYYQIFDKEYHLSDELLARFNEEGLVINGNNDFKANPSNASANGYYHSDGDNSPNHAASHVFSPQHPFKKHMLFSKNYITVNDLKKINAEKAKFMVSSTIYNICINIGTLNYYSAIIDTMNYKIQHFNKVLKWSTLGQFFELENDESEDFNVPVDFSRHHLLKSSVYFKCDCYGYAVVCLLRSQQRESSNTESEIYSMIKNLLEINGDQYKKILTHLKKLDTMNKDKGNRLIINKEIIEEYFLYCWNEILQKNINADDSNERTPDFVYRFDVLKEKISIRYKKNILPIYINIILCFSGALFLKNSGSISTEYYDFCLQYVLFVMNNAILKEFQTFLNEVNTTSNNFKNPKTFQHHYQYLAFVRVLLQFIYNDKDFYEVCIKNRELMKQLAIFSNLCAEYSPEILKKFEPIFDGSKTELKEFYDKPKRTYLYQEDLELLHWKDLTLTDFNDVFKTETNRKKFLNYELLDEERRIMDIPNSKFNSKLEAIINRIIPLLNIFNNEDQKNGISEERLQIVDSKYIYVTGAALAINSFSPLQASYGNNTTAVNNANGTNNNSNYAYNKDDTISNHYQKGKGVQRGSRPHSLLSREGSNSPNMFKQNSQRSYSNGSPSVPSNNSATNGNQVWIKKNSLSSASSPVADQRHSNPTLDSFKSNAAKPKLHQRANSQPNIKNGNKMKNGDFNEDKVTGKRSSPEIEGAKNNKTNDITPVSSINISNTGSYSAGKQANVASPNNHGGLSVSNLNNMFVSWDSGLGGQQMANSQTPTMDYGAGYMPYGAGSAGYNMSGNGLYTTDSNSANSNSGYSNVVGAMNNFTFSPQPNSSNSNGLQTSVSMSSFTGATAGSASMTPTASNSSNIPNSAGTPNTTHPYQAYNSTPNSSYGRYNLATSKSNTPHQGIDSGSPGKTMGWMNAAVPASGSGSIWESSSNGSVPPVSSSAQIGMHNVSRLNQFLGPVPGQGGGAPQQNFRANNSTSFIYNNFQQQRSQSQEHAMGSGYYGDVIDPQNEQQGQPGYPAQQSASRFNGTGQRPNSSAWFN